MATTARPSASQFVDTSPLPRSAGVLLHVTSLPGPHGIGDLGPEAYGWVDRLARAKQTWWQTLPLGPPGSGDSPYQALSAFAGNPLLISLDGLVRDGLLDRTDLPRASLPEGRAQFHRAAALKLPLLRRAHERFVDGRGRRFRAVAEQFAEDQARWLDDFALFMALREAHGGLAWSSWDRGVAGRRPAAITDANRVLAASIELHKFIQFLFFRQLHALRRYAREHGVKLIGDLPIFVSGNSVDVWANPHLFQLDRAGQPTAVAGVPPDVFSATGQRWGNPLYDWNAMRRDGFAWWVSRARAALAQADLVRIDHFRGFEAYWSIPAKAKTAKGGRWVKAPGHELFETLRRELGKLSFIAEDLGVITPEVEALRDAFALPGMRIVQFGFDGNPSNPHLPHNYVHDAIAYTGTHDNDTAVGWFRSLNANGRKLVARYADVDDPAGALVRLCWASVARVAIAPIQDVLGLPSNARMNRPGTSAGNWRWRLLPNAVGERVIERLGQLTKQYARASTRDAKR